MTTPNDRSTQPLNPTRDVESIFHHARGISDAQERAAYLAQACGPDSALRAKVNALLAAGADMGQFLASRNPAERSTQRDTHDRVGTRLDKYKLLQLIGEGGFGTVYLAEQDQPVRRRVALKIIKPGMDSRMVAARFEAERQALAIMDHPHIARVIDGGITDPALGSRPYFVMEYVVGDPITNFADAHKLNIADRLGLFTQVCEAVQHAHTKGIIHRDLKPGNVLVSMVDGKPFVKVIDFGIAKSLASRLTEKTLFTEHRQLIGTPEYMSPEQAEGSPDIDTRADVYALGVLLYELLAGVTPFDGSRLRSAAFAEMQRIIREEEPPLPSVRVMKPALETPSQREGEGGGRNPAHDPTLDPARTRSRRGITFDPRAIKGELDWIVMKALDKDRARRYETANQLTADVRRHLAGEAVVAAPASAGYRLRKFVRKNKGPVVAVSAVGTALLIGALSTTIAITRGVEDRRQRAASQERLNSLAEQARLGFNQILDESAGQATGGMVWSADRTPDSERRVLAIIIEQAVHYIRASKRQSGELEAANASLVRQRDAAKKAMNRVLVEGLGFPGAGIANIVKEGSRQDVTFEQSVATLETVAMEKIKAEREQTNAAEWSAYTANLALAQAAVVANDYPEARRILEGMPESKKGWEYQFVRYDAHSAEWAMQGYFYWPRFSVTEDRLEVCIPDVGGVCHYWAFDAATGAQLGEIEEPATPILSAALSGDGTLDVQQLPKTGRSVEKYVQFWPLRAMRLAIRLTNAYTWYSHVSFGASGDLFVSAVPTSTPESIEVLRVHRAAQWGGPERLLGEGMLSLAIQGPDGEEFRTAELRFPTSAIVVSAILASSPGGPSGLTLTTPDGTRRIVGGADKTVRFYEAKDGKPTLPATAESPGGVYREVAVFRMNDTVTNLQMTGDGLRLIIHLADGSVRVWDIRDPEERRKDLQAEWAERVPAGEYLDSLWNATNADGSLSISDNHLRDAVINDATLTPLRRLVAVEMLEERLEDDRIAAEQAFAAITKDQTDKAAVVAGAAGADLPKRVKARLLATAADWEYKPPQVSPEMRLVEEARRRRVAEVRVALKSVDAGANEADAAAQRRSVLDALQTLRLLADSWAGEFDLIAAALATVAEPSDRILWADLHLRSGDAASALSHAVAAIRQREGDQVFALEQGRNRSPKEHGESPTNLAVLALIRWKLGDPATLDALLHAADYIDEQPDSLTGGRILTRDEHRAAARAALAKARALMAPTTNPDGTVTPSPWADDADAKALLAEAEQLIEGPVKKP